MPINCTKSVFVAALRYAMSTSPPCPPFGDEITACAQQQIDYMLMLGDHLLFTADQQLTCEIKMALSHMFSAFHSDLTHLLTHPHPHLALDASQNNLSRTLMGFEWLCNLLPKLNLMREFVFKWNDISGTIINLLDHQHFESAHWRLKLNIVEITAKVLDGVGYGTVIVPPTTKLKLLNTWLPYIQKIKPASDLLRGSYRMDEDLCQTIQAAIVSIIVTLPSNDQAHILAAWMESQHLAYPDLTEAFEIWCYRTKSSKRRLLEAQGVHALSHSSVSSDLSI